MAKQKEPKEPKKIKVMARDSDPEIERKVDILMTGKSDVEEPTKKEKSTSKQPPKPPKVEDGGSATITDG
jgi:hypothetical protein